MRLLVQSAHAQAAHRSSREDERINVYESCEGVETFWVRSESEGTPPAKCRLVASYRDGEQL